MQAKKTRKKIHPQKFMMWLGMGSLSMAFAGLTSGYVVREAEGGGKTGTRFKINYERKIRLSMIKDWIFNHP